MNSISAYSHEQAELQVVLRERRHHFDRFQLLVSLSFITGVPNQHLKELRILCSPYEMSKPRQYLNQVVSAHKAGRTAVNNPVIFCIIDIQAHLMRLGAFLM